jgi:translation initiation factor 2 beta subunit (eIF-2beta)/eIF-5
MAEKRNTKQFFFCYQAEVMREISLKTEDVKLADVIADKYVCLVRCKVFRSLDPDLDQMSTRVMMLKNMVIGNASTRVSSARIYCKGDIVSR